MAKPIMETPELEGEWAEKFLKQMKEAETSELTERDIIIAKKTLNSRF